PPDTQAHALGRLQLLLQFHEGQIRLLADLLPQPRLYRHRHPAHWATSPRWPLDLPGARERGGDLLGPAFAHSELFRQLPQGPFALLISLQKLSPQIIRVGSCHSGGGGESPRIVYTIAENAIMEPFGALRNEVRAAK